MLDKLKTALVLTIIGALAGFLIWATNDATKGPIALNREDKEKGFYQEIFELEALPIFTKMDLDETYLTEEIEILNDNQELLGYIYKGEDTNSYGDVTILVGIDLEGTITHVVISGSTNTPTFVYNIKTNYLNNFENQTVDDLIFDSKTGASYTYGSTKKIIEEATTYFLENRGVDND